MSSPSRAEQLSTQRFCRQVLPASNTDLDFHACAGILISEGQDRTEIRDMQALAVLHLISSTSVFFGQEDLKSPTKIFWAVRWGADTLNAQP